MKLRSAISCAALLVASMNLAEAIFIPVFAAPTPKHLDGAVSKDQLADALTSSGLQCVLKEGAKPELKVDSVRFGSAAYYQGLVAGDDIQIIHAANGSLNLTIKRGSAMYQVNLPMSAEVALNGTFELSAAVHGGMLNGAAKANDPLLKKENGGLDKSNPKIADVALPHAPVVDIGRQKVPVADIAMKKRLVAGMQRLAQYNIELLIDRTGSMSEVDGTNGLSKFEWCHRQVYNLAAQLLPYQNSITITTFNTTFQTQENCSLESVEQIYAQTTPLGATDLVDPLMARLDAASAIWHRGAKRTLIAVIHDGLPNVPTNTMVVDRAIIDYTKQMRDPNEVIITFLQIGDTFDGRDFCNRLDTNLVTEGAKYDIVNTVDFAQLKRESLVYALMSAVVNNKPVTK